MGTVQLFTGGQLLEVVELNIAGALQQRLSEAGSLEVALGLSWIAQACHDHQKMPCAMQFRRNSAQQSLLQ